jgi:hypothetical protein
MDRNTAANDLVSDAIDLVFSRHALAKAGKMPRPDSGEYVRSVAGMLQNARQLRPDGIEESPWRLGALA